MNPWVMIQNQVITKTRIIVDIRRPDWAKVPLLMCSIHSYFILMFKFLLWGINTLHKLTVNTVFFHFVLPIAYYSIVVVTYLYLSLSSFIVIRGGSRIWLRGGPKFFWLSFADSMQWSHANKVSLYWLGSRARLRALEALGLFITKYAFSPFWGTFLYYF